jgi:hypothetical protein
MEYYSFQDIREGHFSNEPIENTWPQQQSNFQAEVALSQPSQILLNQPSQIPSSRKVDSRRQTLRSSSRPSGDIAYHSDDPKAQRPKRGRPRLDSCAADKRNSGIPPDELSALREYNLEKNRVAAEKCRLRKKRSTAKLSADFDVLSHRNEALKADEASLREELLILKNKVLSHASCGSPIIDGYIAQSAEIKLGTQSPQASRRNSDQTEIAMDHASASTGPASELKMMQSSFGQEYINTDIDTSTYDFLWPVDNEINAQHSWQ